MGSLIHQDPLGWAGLGHDRDWILRYEYPIPDPLLTSSLRQVGWVVRAGRTTFVPLCEWLATQDLRQHICEIQVRPRDKRESGIGEMRMQPRRRISFLMQARRSCAQDPRDSHDRRERERGKVPSHFQCVWGGAGGKAGSKAGSLCAHGGRGFGLHF